MNQGMLELNFIMSSLEVESHEKDTCFEEIPSAKGIFCLCFHSMIIQYCVVECNTNFILVVMMR